MKDSETNETQRLVQQWNETQKLWNAITKFLHASDQIGAANAMDELHRALWQEWEKRHNNAA
jgi:hypothetical protein